MANNSPKPDIPLVQVQSRDTVALPSQNPPGPTESSTSLVSIGDQLFDLPSSTSMNRVLKTTRATRSDPVIPLEHGSPLLKSSTPQSEADQEKKVSFEGEPGLNPPVHTSVRAYRTTQANVSSPNSSPAGRRSNESRSPPRHQSPLGRLFSLPLHRFHSREDPFIPVDPFAIVFSNVSINQNLIFVVDQAVRQGYLYFHLRLPSIYFSRVCRLFQDAEVTRQEIHDLIQSIASGNREFPREWKPPHVSPALSRFKYSWEEFVSSVLREWKTLNVVSALLLSAILTMFQIPDAANDPVTRTAALLSLVSALWSLSFGCIYILRFGTMRSMAKASRWAEEAQKTKTSAFWNVWVLLAMPAIWLAWSMISFCVSILSFVWRTGAASDSPQPPSAGVELGPRIAITCLFALGVVYLSLIIKTFKSYGGIRAKTRSTEIGAEIGGTVAGNAAATNALGLTLSQEAGNGGTRFTGTPVQSSGDLEKGYIPEERGRRVPFASSKL